MGHLCYILIASVDEVRNSPVFLRTLVNKQIFINHILGAGSFIIWFNSHNTWKVDVIFFIFITKELRRLRRLGNFPSAPHQELTKLSHSEIWALPFALSSFIDKLQENYAFPLKEFRIKRKFFPTVVCIVVVLCMRSIFRIKAEVRSLRNGLVRLWEWDSGSVQWRSEKNWSFCL